MPGDSAGPSTVTRLSSFRSWDPGCPWEVSGGGGQAPLLSEAALGSGDSYAAWSWPERLPSYSVLRPEAAAAAQQVHGER
ncbi:hypothetical protein H8959_018462 [Pygathrix nigripes]